MKLKEKDGVETDDYRGERTEDHIESLKGGWLERVLSHSRDFTEFLETNTLFLIYFLPRFSADICQKSYYFTRLYIYPYIRPMFWHILDPEIVAAFPRATEMYL